MQTTVKKLCIDASGKIKTYYRGNFIGHLFAAAFVMFFILMKDAAPSPNSYTAASYYEPKDTVPPPGKLKVYSVSYDIIVWAKKIDTLTAVYNVIGKSLTVDDADRVKSYMNSVLSDMVRQIQSQQDTVKNKNK